jgi:hypothetical protein
LTAHPQEAANTAKGMVTRKEALRILFMIGIRQWRCKVVKDLSEALHENVVRTLHHECP